MAELQKLLQSNAAFKSELMEAVLSQSGRDPAKTVGSQTSTTQSLKANLNVTNINKTATTTTTTLSKNINDNNSTSKLIIDNGFSGNTNTNNRNNLTGASNVDSNDSSSATTVQNNANVNANVNMNNAPNTKRDQEQHFYVDPKANCLADVHKVLTQMKDTSTEKCRLLIDQITDVTTEAHMATTLNTQANIMEANERIARQQGAQPHGMPDMSKLNINPGMMMQKFLTSMVAEMTKVVNFSKSLPGFSDVDTDDQIKLIRQGLFEVMISRITLLIDCANDTMIDPSLKMKSPRAVVRQMPPLGPFIDQFFDIAQNTNPLNLTDGENGLFGAILIFCPDRHGLKNVSAVQTIQQLYLQALYLLMRHNHKDADERFCSLISAIPSIRKINDDHFRLVSNIKQKSTTEYESHFPQLHRELFDTSLH